MQDTGHCERKGWGGRGCSGPDGRGMPGTRGLGAGRERDKACKTMSSQMSRTWAQMVRGKEEPRAAEVPEPAPGSTKSRDRLTSGYRECRWVVPRGTSECEGLVRDFTVENAGV